MDTQNSSTEMSNSQQHLKQMESELHLLQLANQQLIEENQALNNQMEAVLQENVTKIEVILERRVLVKVYLNCQ
jgi:hypothetical protein